MIPHATAGDAPMDLNKVGKYDITAKIGQGAMGEVYKAHDPILNRFVAIKTMSAAIGTDDELRKRFLREAQSAARLNHPNIITLFDFGEDHGKIYMAMELWGQRPQELISNRASPAGGQAGVHGADLRRPLAFAHMQTSSTATEARHIPRQPNGQSRSWTRPWPPRHLRDDAHGHGHGTRTTCRRSR